MNDVYNKWQSFTCGEFTVTRAIKINLAENEHTWETTLCINGSHNSQNKANIKGRQMLTTSIAESFYKLQSTFKRKQAQMGHSCAHPFMINRIQ